MKPNTSCNEKIIVIDDNPNGYDGNRLVLDLQYGLSNTRLVLQRQSGSGAWESARVLPISESELDRALMHLRSAKLEDRASQDLALRQIQALSMEDRIEAALLEKARHHTKDLLGALAMERPIKSIVRSLIGLLAPLGDMIDRDGGARMYAKQLDLKARRIAGLCSFANCPHATDSDGMCKEHLAEEEARLVAFENELA